MVCLVTLTHCRRSLVPRSLELVINDAHNDIEASFILSKGLL